MKCKRCGENNFWVWMGASSIEIYCNECFLHLSKPDVVDMLSKVDIKDLTLDPTSERKFDESLLKTYEKSPLKYTEGRLTIKEIMKISLVEHSSTIRHLDKFKVPFIKVKNPSSRGARRVRLYDATSEEFKQFKKVFIAKNRISGLNAMTQFLGIKRHGGRRR